MTEAIVPFLIAICIFLFLTAAIYRYSRKFILPAVTLMMIFGAIAGLFHTVDELNIISELSKAKNCNHK